MFTKKYLDLPPLDGLINGKMKLGLEELEYVFTYEVYPEDFRAEVMALWMEINTTIGEINKTTRTHVHKTKPT